MGEPLGCLRPVAKLRRAAGGDNFCAQNGTLPLLPPPIFPTLQVGVQEKTAFVQAYGKPASLYAPIMCLPAVIQVLLLLTAMAVLFHHAPPAAAQHAPQSPQWRQQQHESDGAEAALVTAQLSEAEAAASEYDERHSAGSEGLQLQPWLLAGLSPFDCC